MAQSIEVLILGDVCPAEGLRELFDRRCGASIFGSLAERIKAADISIFNLECVLSGAGHPMEKIGPVLVGKPADAEVLASIGFDVAGLANNHIKDCGAAGVVDTLEACHMAGIQTVGAGLNAEAAAKAAFVNVKGTTVCVMALAEHEFNAATSQGAGAHIFNPLRDLERIAEMRRQCDFLVILYHGGIEHFPLPSPRLQEACRSMVRNGADLVLCQHSHVIGAVEEYQGAQILYGQGNGAYGYRAGNTLWNEGLAVSVVLSKDALPSERPVVKRVEYLPIGCDPTGRVDLLEQDRARNCINGFEARSRDVLVSAKIEKEWESFVRGLSTTHLPHLLGFGRIATRINRITGGLLFRTLYSRRQKLVSMNVIRCESHREVLEAALQNELSSKQG